MAPVLVEGSAAVDEEEPADWVARVGAVDEEMASVVEMELDLDEVALEEQAAPVDFHLHRYWN